MSAIAEVWDGEARGVLTNRWRTDSRGWRGPFKTPAGPAPRRAPAGSRATRGGEARGVRLREGPSPTVAATAVRRSGPAVPSSVSGGPSRSGSGSPSSRSGSRPGGWAPPAMDHKPLLPERPPAYNLEAGQGDFTCGPHGYGAIPTAPPPPPYPYLVAGSTTSTAEMSPGTLPIPSSSWEAARSAGMSQAWGRPQKLVRAHTASRGRIVGEWVSLDLGQLLTCRVDSACFHSRGTGLGVGVSSLGSRVLLGPLSPKVGVLEDSFTFLGIFLAIVLFPFGFICCFALKKRRCPNCGANFT
ncbi:hypothetical protein MC885_001372 [Smutsia gigantea]|nr:hypothetical protein MC885_001372 [Smutsia gigantea]